MQKKNIKVSIITVSYNEVKTIEQTMLSVFNQTYNNIEYIIIDGNSTDGTQSVIEKYKDRLAYYVSESDNGLYEAMNKGIQKATGDIVGMINANDWYESDAVEKAVSCFKNADAEVVYAEVRYISENEEERCSKRRPLSELWYHNVVQHPSVFCNRELYKRYGLFDLKYRVYADYDLMLRWYENRVKFVHVEGVAANFRLGGLSTSLSSIDEYRHIAFLHLDKCTDYNHVTLAEMIDKEYACLRVKDIMMNNSQILEGYLVKQYPDIEDGVYIWGSGKWGKMQAELLEKINIPIIAFVDNNSKKWGTYLNAIPIENPNILRKGEHYVLIAVKGYASDIVDQLKDFKNNGIIWFTLEDICSLLE